MHYIDFFKTEDRKDTIPLQLSFNKDIQKYFKVQSDIYIKNFQAQAEVSIFKTVKIKKTLEEDLAVATTAMIPIWEEALLGGIGLGIEAVNTELQIEFTLGFGVEVPEALAFAESRAADMITKVDQTTKDIINRIISTGIQEGQDVNTIAKAIQEQFIDFGKFRSKLIASQEVGESYEFGKYEQSKAIQKDTKTKLEKAWITQGDDRVDEEVCAPNEAEEYIPLESAYQSGHERPLGHIGCRCYQTTRAKK